MGLNWAPVPSIFPRSFEAGEGFTSVSVQTTSLFMGGNGGADFDFDGLWYMPGSGLGAANNRFDVETYCPRAGIVQNFVVNVQGNTMDAATTITIQVGTTSTPLTADIIVEESDFRNQTNTTVLRISSVSGDPTGSYRIKGNTFYYTSKKVILLHRRNGCLFTENVIYNMELGNLRVKLEYCGRTYI